MTDQVALDSLLARERGRLLESEVRLDLSSQFLDEPLVRKLSHQEVFILAIVKLFFKCSF
jgi:hypothetical protein